MECVWGDRQWGDGKEDMSLWGTGGKDSNISGESYTLYNDTLIKNAIRDNKL